MQLNYAALRTLNTAVNEAVRYTADPEQYRRPDWWADALEAGAGDCEDYAIAKLRRLLALGWPRERLKLGLCYVETGEYHCVLVVTDADGEDWVLDNRYPLPVRWEMLDYRWDRFYLLGERAWRAAAA